MIYANLYAVESKSAKIILLEHCLRDAHKSMQYHIDGSIALHDDMLEHASDFDLREIARGYVNAPDNIKQMMRSFIASNYDVLISDEPEKPVVDEALLQHLIDVYTSLNASSSSVKKIHIDWLYSADCIGEDGQQNIQQAAESLLRELNIAFTDIVCQQYVYSLRNRIQDGEIIESGNGDIHIADAFDGDKKVAEFYI